MRTQRLAAGHLGLAGGVALTAVALIAATPTPGPLPRIDQARAVEANLAEEPSRVSYTPEWFSRRYAVAPPTLALQTFGGLFQGRVLVLCLRADKQGDDTKLWDGLKRDLAPNQSLGRVGSTIVVVTSEKREKRKWALSSLAATAEVEDSDLGWLVSQLPDTVQGLETRSSMFLPDLPHEEQTAGGISLRAVWQRDFWIPHTRLPRNFAQAAFWVPRQSSQVGDLAGQLDHNKQTYDRVFRGAKAVAVVRAYADTGDRILASELAKRGYVPMSERTPEPATTPPPTGSTGQNEHGTQPRADATPGKTLLEQRMDALPRR